MEYVNKTLGHQRAHDLLQRFLNRCLRLNPYPADLYDAMKADVEPDTALNPDGKSTYRLLLGWILDESHIDNDHMPDREGYCCYCMRKIKADTIYSTLEHVIPKMVVDPSAYRNYFTIPSNLEQDEHVMVLKTVFVNRHHRIAPPFPHNVAYENLVASCNGSLPKGSNNHVCCNGPRDNHYIPPLMFMPSIHQEITYKRSGMVIWKNNQHVDKRECKRVINDELNLNCDILRIIRMIWCHLAENGKDCNLNKKEKRRVIDTLRPQCLTTMDREVLQNFLENDNYWGLIEEYSYFNDTQKFT